MSWSELYIVLVVSHLGGDFLLQTEWQATTKHHGLGSDPEHRRALCSHVLTYALVFLPALVWVGDVSGVAAALVLALVAFGTHLVQDDGRLLQVYVRRVKKTDAAFGTVLMIAIDQSFHLVWLLLAALLVGLAF